MAGKKDKERKGQYICGKCGEGFGNARDLGVHVSRGHKSRRRAAGKRSVRREKAPARRPTVIDEACGKCGRKDFVNRFSLAQHRRFCKGRAATVVPPIGEAAAQAFSGPTAVDMARGQTAMNGGVADRLKAEAAALRKRSDEILEYVKSFEAGAARYLSK